MLGHAKSLYSCEQIEELGSPTARTQEPSGQIFYTDGFHPTVDGVSYETHFAVRLSGTFRAPSDGRAAFWLRSDDGSQLYIKKISDGTCDSEFHLVVNNDWRHADRTRWGKMKLEQGALYRFVVYYFQASGRNTLQLYWQPSGYSDPRILQALLTPASQSLTLGPDGQVTTGSSGGLLESVGPAAQASPPDSEVALDDLLSSKEVMMTLVVSILLSFLAGVCCALCLPRAKKACLVSPSSTPTMKGSWAPPPPGVMA